MKKFILILTVAFMFSNCEDTPSGPPPSSEGNGSNHTKKYPSEVATQWINMQQRLIKTTPGFDPLVASRSFAYSGITLYESVLKGMPSYRSIVSPRIGVDINKTTKQHALHYAASANAAMAFILKNLFGNTSDANKAAIDSLESVFNTKFQSQASAQVVDESSAYGKEIARHIFEWSKTDGGHEAYLKATSDTYSPPTGPGLWVPTPPANSKPIRPYWGDNRSFVPNSAVMTLPVAPPAYSENTESEFYKMVTEVYNISQSLSDEDIKIVKHWGDLPGNYGTPAHYTHIVTQLIDKKSFNLEMAAYTYAKHGIAINEALICVFKAKYTYNLIRPISQIRSGLGYDTWNTVIGTPPHPEYPSAHAVIGGASYVVLEDIFGKKTSIVDRTHENLYGARTYNSLKAYAEEASWSRVLGGIHYKVSATVGLSQGEKVGALVNTINFKGNPNQ